MGCTEVRTLRYVALRFFPLIKEMLRCCYWVRIATKKKAKNIEWSDLQKAHLRFDFDSGETNGLPHTNRLLQRKVRTNSHHRLRFHRDYMDVPLRPIVSWISSLTYELAKYLARLLRPLIGQLKHRVKKSGNLVNKLRTSAFRNRYLASFDTVSLFTEVPLEHTLRLLLQLLDSQIVALSRQVRTTSHSLYNSSLYDQTDGVAMWSSLAPAIRNPSSSSL